MLCSLGGLTWVQAAPAQKNCANTPTYFQPSTDSDGQRYPLSIGPATWHLLGSGIYPVEGSDGRIHIAFAMLFTNAWSAPTTIRSVEVVDPSRNHQPTGTNRVLSIDDEDVMGEMRPLKSNANLNKSGYSQKLTGSSSGVMYFDVSYANSNEVPCAIALRVHSVQPEVKELPESTVLGRPLKLSSQIPVVISPPLKGEGWVNANGCCLEVGPHRFVVNAMNGTLDPSEALQLIGSK